MRSTPNKLTSGTYKSGTVRVRLSRDDPNRMAGLRNDSRIASRRVGRHLCADRDSRPSSLRASTYIRGADCDHGHGVRVVMGQRRCPFRPARVPERRFLKGTAPYWLAGLWALFAIQLNTVLHWLRARPLISALVGAFAGWRPFAQVRRWGPFISGSGRSARRCRNRLGDHLAGRACDCKPLGWRNAPFSCTNRRRRHERRPRRIEPGASQAGFISDHAKHANRSH